MRGIRTSFPRLSLENAAGQRGHQDRYQYQHFSKNLNLDRGDAMSFFSFSLFHLPVSQTPTHTHTGTPLGFAFAWQEGSDLVPEELSNGLPRGAGDTSTHVHRFAKIAHLLHANVMFCRVTIRV